MLPPPAVHAVVVKGDSGSVAVWNEGDSTWVYVVGRRGNAVMPAVTDSVLRAVGISPDNAKTLREPPPLSYEHIDAYFDFQVDRQAREDSLNPKPQYPDVLRPSRVEGKVIVQFIVDSTGRPILGSFKVLRKPNRLFALAVFAVLPDFRFEPAQVKGQPVAELLQVPFVFGRSADPIKIGGVGGSVTVSFDHDTSWLSMETRRGTFVVHTDSFTMAAWADTVAHARAPLPHGAKQEDYALIKLAYPEPSLSAIVAMGITRLSADSASPYQCGGSNGSWAGSMVLPYDSAQRVFTAMRGLSSTMRVWRGAWSDVDHPRPLKPNSFERQARPRSGNSPPYPEALRVANREGNVLLQFVVDTTGLVDVSTARILKSSHPLFALAVYQKLPAMRFEPAMVNGKKVKELVQQPYAFNLLR